MYRLFLFILYFLDRILTNCVKTIPSKTHENNILPQKIRHCINTQQQNIGNARLVAHTRN